MVIVHPITHIMDTTTVVACGENVKYRSVKKSDALDVIFEPYFHNFSPHFSHRVMGSRLMNKKRPCWVTVISVT